MSGIQWTYGQVRDYVQGSGCTKNNDRIELMVTTCLQELWTVVCDDPYYEADIGKPLAEGESKVDISECATISTIKIRYDDPDGVERCRTLTPRSTIPEVKGCCETAVGDVCEHDVVGIPEQFTIIGNNLCVFPTASQDVTVELRCFREVDCTLYTMDDGVRIWNSIDLPERYQPQLANLVLSKFYAEQGDFAAATYWEQKVSTGLDSLVEKQSNRYDPEAGEASACAEAPFQVVRRGSRKGCDSKCGCHGCNPIMQTLYEEVLVDCNGNRVHPEIPEEQPAGGKW